MEKNNNNRFDDEDAGIFMKQDSIFSPTPMTPTLHRSNLLSAESPDSPNHKVNAEMKKVASFGNMGNQNEARVLVLYTGGTIGMLRNDKHGKQLTKENWLVMRWTW